MNDQQFYALLSMAINLLYMSEFVCVVMAIYELTVHVWAFECCHGDLWTYCTCLSLWVLSWRSMNLLYMSEFVSVVMAINGLTVHVRVYACCHGNLWTYCTCLSLCVLSWRSMSVWRISWTMILMPASSNSDIRSSGCRNSCGNALDMATVLYLVATWWG